MHCLLFAPLLFAHETYLALVCVVYWTMMHCLWCDFPAMGIANSAYVCAYHEAAIRDHLAEQWGGADVWDTCVRHTSLEVVWVLGKVALRWVIDRSWFQVVQASMASELNSR